MKSNTILTVFIVIMLFFGSSILPISSQFLPKKQIGSHSEMHPLLTDITDFDEKVQFYMKLGHIPSLSICSVKNDQLILSKSYGFYDLTDEKQATEDTVYMIGSISKMFVALGMMQLYEDGCFSLDDNINDYLPFNVSNPSYPNTAITFRMLLAHQSSLGNTNPLLFFYFSILGYPNDWLDEVLNPDGFLYTSQVWEDYAPGEQKKYSSLGYELLGFLLEQISHQSIQKYCKKYIFQPLEMDNTSFLYSDINREHIALPYLWFSARYHRLPLYDTKNKAAGGLKSTLSDFSHFLIVHLNNGSFNDTRILEKETIDLMQTMHYPDGDGFAWRFDEFSDGNTYLNHAGTIPGYYSRIIISSKHKYGIMYSTNQYNLYPDIENSLNIDRLEQYARGQIEYMFLNAAASN